MQETDLVFHPLDRSWSDQLNTINRACPIEADFTLIFERGDDFFKWPELVFEQYLYVGAFYRERLIGYIMVGQYIGWTGIEYGTCSYLGDARVLPGFRGRNIAKRLISEIAKRLPVKLQLGFALVKKGNRAAESLISSAPSPRYEASKTVPFQVLNIPLLKALPDRDDIDIHRAAGNDFEDMVELYVKANANKLFAPKLTLEGLRREFDAQLEVNGREYLLASQGGRLVGMIATWDMYPFHYTNLLKYSAIGLVTRSAYNILTRLYKNATPLPTAGNVLRSLTVSRVAILDDNPMILRSLLAEAIQSNLGKGYQFLSVGFTSCDPLLSGGLGFPLVQRFSSSVVIIAPQGRAIIDDRLQIDLEFI